MKLRIVESKIPASDVYELVQNIHPRKDDLEEGDLTDRIYQYDVYEERQIPIEIIDVEWDINDNYVNKLIQKINNGKQIEPIVLDDDYGIIDGAHRVAAYKKIGIRLISALVGKK
jgi:hypothetical protein